MNREIAERAEKHEQSNLELTQASYRIAEATLSDAKSMRTIAVLTMVLLPGTAVASLFSMGMFNWSANDGARIASKWTWIYFVVTIPLTVAILAAWWIWSRRSMSVFSSSGRPVQPANDAVVAQSRDAELGRASNDGDIELEMHHIVAKPEAND